MLITITMMLMIIMVIVDCWLDKCFKCTIYKIYKRFKFSPWTIFWFLCNIQETWKRLSLVRLTIMMIVFVYERVIIITIIIIIFHSNGYSSFHDDTQWFHLPISLENKFSPGIYNNVFFLFSFLSLQYSRIKLKVIRIKIS